MAKTDQKACLSTSKDLPPDPPCPSSKPRGDGDDGGGGVSVEAGHENHQNAPPAETIPSLLLQQPKPNPKSNPDYILTLAYIVLYLQVGWLILWILRSYSRD